MKGKGQLGCKSITVSIDVDMYLKPKKMLA